MIKITENYRLIGKDLNFTIESNYTVKENAMTNPENIGASRWQTIGYFTTFTAIENFVKNKMNVNEEEINNLYDLLDYTNNIIESFKSVEIPKNIHLKVIVNQDWYFIGTNMFYRIIKRESIKNHRFTKEENIGKDKFINIGATPNAYLSLKTILNTILLEYLSSDEYNTIDEIKKVIDSFVADVEKIKFIEVSPNSIDSNVEEEIEDEIIEEAIEDVEDEIECCSNN